MELDTIILNHQDKGILITKRKNYAPEHSQGVHFWLICRREPCSLFKKGITMSAEKELREIREELGSIRRAVNGGGNDT